MKTIHKNMSVDQVDDTMAEIQEQMDVAAEISTAISQPLGDTGAEEDLEAELEALEQEDLNDKLSAIESSTGLALPSAPAKTGVASPTIKSPAVPTTDPHDEAAQLAALEAEMSAF